MEKRHFDKLEYSNIDSVKTSVYRRNYEMIVAIIVNEYYLDITINSNDGFSYHFEIQTWSNFIEMVNKFRLEKINMIDPLSFYNNYLCAGSNYFEELDADFDNLVSIHNLQNYRCNNKK